MGSGAVLYATSMGGISLDCETRPSLPDVSDSWSRDWFYWFTGLLARDPAVDAAAAPSS